MDRIKKIHKEQRNSIGRAKGRREKIERVLKDCISFRMEMSVSKYVSIINLIYTPKVK